MPKTTKIYPLKILDKQIQYKAYMITGVDLSVETIKQVRMGNRSQTTPTGKLIMNTEQSIKDFFKSEK